MHATFTRQPSSQVHARAWLSQQDTYHWTRSTRARRGRWSSSEESSLPTSRDHSLKLSAQSRLSRHWAASPMSVPLTRSQLSASSAASSDRLTRIAACDRALRAERENVANSRRCLQASSEHSSYLQALSKHHIVSY